LTLPRFDGLTVDQKNALFNDGVNTFLEFPGHIKARGFRAAMKMIAKLWRSHKSNLVNRYMAKDLEPFSKYPYIKREDWEAFVALKSSEAFQTESSAKKLLRAKHKQPHILGTGGYMGKRPIWQAENDKLANEGRENPWLQFPGRSQSYLRARGKLSDSGEITFTSGEIEAVAEKVKEKAAQSFKGSFTGVREHDELSSALGNPEHPGCVRGVSSSQGWKLGFPEHIGMYKKRKRSGDIDVEALTQSITETVYQGIVQRFAAQGVVIPSDPAGDSPIARGKSSQASREVEQPVFSPSMEPDTIDLLDGPTPCSLVIRPGGYQIEVAKGQVHPEVQVLHTVPIRPGYAVVFVDFVHANAVDTDLPVPPNDEIQKLGQARLQRIQWNRGAILVQATEPSRSDPPRPSSAPSSLPQPQPRDEPAASPLPAPPPPARQPEGSPEKKSKQGSKKQLPQKSKSKGKEPVVEKRDIGAAWTRANPKFQPGKPLMMADPLRRAGQPCVELHNYYLQGCRAKKSSIVLQYQNRHFLNGDGYFLVGFNDLYDLFNLDGMDVGLLRCWTL
jgi:hypothetical protein